MPRDCRVSGQTRFRFLCAWRTRTTSCPGQRNDRAFTLLEMIITMAIFVLIAGAVFGICMSVLKSVSSLQDNQDRRDQIVALNAFLKKKLGDLSAQSVLVSYRRGDGEGLTQNGIIFGESGHQMAIDAKVQANGYYMLRLATFGASITQNGDPTQAVQQALQNDDASVTWAPLMRDIQKLDWKFQDVNVTQWADFWNNTGSKPNLIELSLQPAGEANPVVMDFWIPQIVPTTLVLPQTTTTTSTNAAPGTNTNTP